jgi:hypothetical protein
MTFPFFLYLSGRVFFSIGVIIYTYATSSVTMGPTSLIPCQFAPNQILACYAKKKLKIIAFFCPANFVVLCNLLMQWGYPNYSSSG